MPSFIDLLCAYGICFGLMNKVEVLRKVAFFDRMLSCSYCTGFHAGWLTWVFSRSVYGLPEAPKDALPALAWAFASAASCFVVDATTQAVERIALPAEKD